MKNFRGTGVALVTPFNERGEVDFPAIDKLLHHTSTVDYLVVLGTTAESVTLTPEEKHTVLRYIVEKNNGQKPVVVGVGGNNTMEVVGQLLSMDFSGVDAILSVVPYYNKPSQNGIYAHYAKVLEVSPLPVILYNVPGRTGVNMSAKTTLKLAHDFPQKAIAVKEASGDLSQAAYIIRDKPDDFLVISGDDNLTMPMIAMGGEGVISVSANSFPDKMSEMVNLALKGETIKARKLSLELWEATDLLFAEGNPVGVKMALSLKKIMQPNVRLPLVEASKQLTENMKRQIEKFKL